MRLRVRCKALRWEPDRPGVFYGQIMATQAPVPLNQLYFCALTPNITK